MSNFLGIPHNLINPSSLPQDAQNAISGALATGTWQVLRKALVVVATAGTFTNPGRATDLDPASMATAAALPATISVQMPSGYTPTALYMQAGINTGGAVQADAPAAWSLDYSDNGTSWTTLQSWTAQANWGTQEVRKYTVTGAGSHAYWRINVTANNGAGSTAILGWWLEDASGAWSVSQAFLDTIPPVGETIGNATAREVVRMWFNPTTIGIAPIQELLTALPQIWSWDTATAGAVTHSITINGATVSFTGSAGNTALQNARGLYAAIRASADANFTAFTWKWLPSLANVQGGAYFIATQNTPGPGPSFTSSGLTTRYRAQYAQPAVQCSGFPVQATISLDLVFGTYWYLQITSRGLALVTKTNTATSGAVHMCYQANADAVAATPAADFAGAPCTPVELFVGTDAVAANAGGTARVSHFWGVAGTAITPAAIHNSEDGGSAFSPSVFNKMGHTGIIQDFGNNSATSLSSSGTGYYTTTMVGEGMFSGADEGSIWPIQRLAANPMSTAEPYVAYGVNGRIVSPGSAPLDWYKYMGASPTSEQTIIGPSNDFTTALTSAIASGDTTIPATNPIAAGFPSAGTLVIDGEIVSYTGTTTSGFTGCARGRNSTTAQSNPAGTPVNIAGHWIAVNTSLLFAGYTAPS